MFDIVKRFLAPRSSDEDSRRKEFILNVLVLSAIFLFSSAVLVSGIAAIDHPESYAQNSVSLLVLFCIVAFFIFLYFLSRKGFFRLASYLLITPLFLLAAYMGYQWGVDLPAEILFYSVLIIMSGILISTRFAFVVTLIICATIITTGYLHNTGIVEVNRYWSSETWAGTDMAVASVLFLIIATVSWLSNREIEKSLARARKSEADLKDERDSLEVKVEQRTKELKEVQAEKMTQLYRFAEFGRISSGLFHDLINPLNAVSLNLGKTDGTREETMQYVGNAVRAAKKLEDLVVAVRKQLAREETKTLFLIEEEIRYVIEVLFHKAQRANVELRFIPRSDIKMFGDAIKFNQVVLNLVANGIDACIPPATELVPVSPGDRWVQVSLVVELETITILVEDNGVGMPEHHIDKIFEPFFTTKINGQGIGLGLSITKRIVEKDFGGLLLVESRFGEGSKFKAHLPIRKHTIEYA